MVEILIKTAPSDPMLPAPYRIERMSNETHDTFTIELEPLNGGGLCFAPGQFNMLYMFGIGESAISISGDSEKDGPLIHAIRAVGTVTRAMKKLKRGDVIGVRGPYGSSWPVEEA